jgi:hypothetical protein
MDGLDRDAGGVASELDQCGEYSPRGNRCSKQDGHGGQHSFEELIPIGPVIHCPFGRADDWPYPDEDPPDPL